MARPLTIEQRDSRLGIWLIAPSVLVFLCLIAYPLVDSVWMSFRQINTITLDGHYVGLRNYEEIISSPDFWRSLINNFIWTAGALTLQVVAGIAIGLMLHQNVWCRSLARGLILFPYLLPMVVAVLVWKWLFNDLYGLLNAALVHSGLVDFPVDWLGGMPSAMISIIVVGAWKYFPFVVLTVLARLQSIPEQLYEAAKIDGAGPLARFVDITLPQLRGVLVIVVLLRAIWDFKEFDLIYMMTGGGPVISTQTLPLLVFKHAFPLQQLGKGAAVAVIMMLIMLVFMLCYLRLYGREQDK
ncbi:carbohydrate ABC transporter permease [Ferrovibrio sp.]|uniref:carbohydrate ABC transporter permease n=1 Tax=Ferrovibrio sp. TaxID=1917215 RepID=UPI003D2B24F0